MKHFIEKLRLLLSLSTPPHIKLNETNKNVYIDDDKLDDITYLSSVPAEHYQVVLARIFERNTGEKLDFKSPKTFNQKIQWLKLNDNLEIKSELTDKVKVRDWVKDKIGEEYLKPVLYVCDKFDEIPFSELPQKFIIKTNHGCKWHFTIKDKDRFLSEQRVYNLVKNKFNDWLNLSFTYFAGFELQYENIVPKLIVEPLLCDANCTSPIDIQVFCFNGKPKIYEVVTNSDPRMSTIYNEDFSESDIKFFKKGIYIHQPVSEKVKQAAELSKILCKEFKFVRVDWIVCDNKLYFNEMTFTPQSGFYDFPIPKHNILIGNMLKIK